MNHIISVTENCVILWVSSHPDRKYKIDFEKYNTFVLEHKKNKHKYKFIENNSKYPHYTNNNNKPVSLIQAIHHFPNNVDYLFKNENHMDLRDENVSCRHVYHSKIIQQYPNAKYIPGHIMRYGRDAGFMKNPIWEVINDNHKVMLFMLCEKNALCKLCPDAYQKIIDFEKMHSDSYGHTSKITFSLSSNKYIQSSSNLFIHQIIMNCHGNGKGTKNISVDHIDQDPLNNCLDNLRIATRVEQEQNSNGIKTNTKRARKTSAKNLPMGITQSMMKKYVVYYNECYNKEKGLYREFFKVEKHPKMVSKIWISSKSNKITIHEKLMAANNVVEQLEKDIFPKKDNVLPTYVNLSNMRGKPHLIYDRKTMEGMRQTLRMVLPENYEMETSLPLFMEKVAQKFNIN